MSRRHHRIMSEQERELENLRLKDREKLALERELVRQEKIYPRAHYMPRGRFRGILAVCLAFFFGIFLTLGALVGAGVWLGTQPVDDVFHFFGIDADQYNQYLDEAYSKLSISELVQDILNNEFANIHDISKYSPFIEDLVDKLIEQADTLGIPIQKNKLLYTNFDELGAYFQDEVLMNIELGRTLKLDASSSYLMLALCYGEEGVDFEFNEDGSIHVLNSDAVTTVGKLTKDEGISEIINKLSLGGLLVLDNEPHSEEDIIGNIMYAIAYGNYGTDFTLDENGHIKMLDGKKPTRVGDLIEDPATVIQSLEVEALLGVPGKDAEDLVYYIFYGSADRYTRNEDGSVTMKTDPETGKPYPKRTVGDLMNDEFLDGVLVGDIFPGRGGLLGAVAEWPIDDLGNSERIESLEIGEIIDIDSTTSALIKSLAKNTIGDLKDPNRINRIKIGQIVGDSDSRFMKAIADWRLGDLSDESKINRLTLSNILGIGDDDGILTALKDIPLGDLSKEVKELRLSDILGEDAMNNKLLSHLKDSTLDTLASDLDNLTVADVFGDEIYSFMEIKTVGGQRYDYNFLRTTYFLTDSATVEGKKNYQTEEYNKYDYDGKELPEDATVWRPKAIERTRDGQSVEITTYYTIGETRVTKSFYEGTTLVDGAAVHKSFNEDGTPAYYIERKIVFEKALYDYLAFDYDNFRDENGNIVADGTNHTFKVNENDVKTDENGELYYENDGVKYEVDRTVRAYVFGGETYLLTDGSVSYEGETYRVRHSEDSDYFTARIPVEERYAEGDAFVTGDAVERYEYKNENGNTVELDRYLAGAWYLMLGGVDKDNVPVDKTNTPILQMDNLISNASNTMQDTLLASLWFHEVLQENPYAELPRTYTLDHGSYTNEVDNLIDATLGETIALIKMISSDLKNLGWSGGNKDGQGD